jgi:hypothetical protein
MDRVFERHAVETYTRFLVAVLARCRRFAHAGYHQSMTKAPRILDGIVFMGGRIFVGGKVLFPTPERLVAALSSATTLQIKRPFASSAL